MKIDIRIVEGGERLYVYPVSYNMDFRKNKVLYLKQESLPYYKNDLLYDFWNKNPLIKEHNYLVKIWYCFFKRLMVSFKDYVSQDYRKYWRHYVPIVGVEIFEPRLVLHNQLKVIDPGYLSDTYYLIPSDYYVDKALTEQYSNDAEMDAENGIYDRDIYVDLFLPWKNRQIAEGRSVGYIVSLDT